MYTPHAQIAKTENFYGQLHQPTQGQLIVIDAYRERCREAFGEWPAGTHWIDELKELVVLRRPGGLPGSTAAADLAAAEEEEA